LLLNNEFAGFVPSSFIFWSTLFIYQINTRDPLRLFKEFSLKTIHRRGFLETGIIFSSLIITILHIPFLNLPTVLFAGGLGLLSILYNLPEKTLTSNIIPLRGIPLLKIFIIALVWAGISSLLPLALSQKLYFSGNAFLLFVANFLFILGITLPFDIRDFVNDQKKSLLTIPHVMGILYTKMLALLSISGFAVLMSFLVGWIFLLPLLLATTILIVKTTPERNEFYFTFWLDGTILLYFLVIYLSLEFQA
jgi:4-hydroxybenzoate polyprenyltransferase